MIVLGLFLGLQDQLFTVCMKLGWCLNQTGHMIANKMGFRIKLHLFAFVDNIKL